MKRIKTIDNIPSNDSRTTGRDEEEVCMCRDDRTKEEGAGEEGGGGGRGHPISQTPDDQ